MQMISSSLITQDTHDSPTFSLSFFVKQNKLSAFPVSFKKALGSEALRSSKVENIYNASDPFSVLPGVMDFGLNK
jgi:hypothetical protein